MKTEHKQPSPNSKATNDFETADKARIEAAAKLATAKQALQEAQAKVDALKGLYDAATLAMANGEPPSEPPAAIRGRLADAEDALRGAGIAAKQAQSAMHAADAVYQPLAAAEQRRIKQARLDDLAGDYRTHLAEARRLLDAGRVHVRALESIQDKLLNAELKPEGLQLMNLLARETTGLPVVAGTFDPGQVGNVRWGSR